MRLRPKHSMGFTLIELIVCLSIISALTGISIPTYKNYSNKAKCAQALGDLKEIQYAIELLSMDTDRWPGPSNAGDIAAGGANEVWDLCSPQAGLVATNGGFPGWNGPYMDSVQKDPWGSDYFFDSDYRINGEDFAVIGSFGPNKVGPNQYDSDDVIIVLSAD